MIGLIAAALALAASHSPPEPTADDYGRLDELYARAMFEQGCDGGDSGAERDALRLRYESRFRAAKAWFEQRYSSGELHAASDRAFGNTDHVMVGACRMRDGVAEMADTRAFTHLLGNVERETGTARKEGR